MNILKLLLIAGIAGGGWHYWSKQQATQAQAAATSPSGFVSLPLQGNPNPVQVLIVAPENCSADAARHADDLEIDLRRAGISVRRTHQVNFEFSGGGADTMQRIQQVMNSGPPVVFIGNRAKGSPTLAEVLAEYRR